MIPRWKEQLGGTLIAMIGAGFTAWTWYTALCKGYFNLKAAILFPVFLVLGIGMILFPGYKSERVARGEDISHLEGSRLITPRWWVILGVGLVE